MTAGSFQPLAGGLESDQNDRRQGEGHAKPLAPADFLGKNRSGQEHGNGRIEGGDDGGNIETAEGRGQGIKPAAADVQEADGRHMRQPPARYVKRFLP